MSRPKAITISGRAVLPDGTTQAGVIYAYASEVIRDANSGDLVYPGTLTVPVAADGEVSFQLGATDDPNFSPTGWTWQIRVHFPGWHDAFDVAVPYSSPGDAIRWSSLVPVPPDGTADLYALVNHTHEGGGNGPSPSGTVADSTAFSLAAVVGVSSTYSRGDHRHGTPALPTASDVGAEAAGAVAAHAAASNPHPTYLTQTEGDALYEPLGGGGGGAAAVVRRLLSTSGNLTPQSTASWAALTGAPTLALPAAIGDYVEFEVCDQLWSPSSNFLDVAVLVSGAPVRFLSTGTSTPGDEGAPAYYPQPGSFRTYGPLFEFEVASGDLSGGNVTFGWVTKGNGTGTFYQSSVYPLKARAINHGPCDVA